MRWECVGAVARDGVGYSARVRVQCAWKIAGCGLPVLGTLPIDPAIAAACDDGTFEDALPEGLLSDAVAFALDLPELEVAEQEPKPREPTMAERAAAAAAAYKAKKADAADGGDTVDVTPSEV